ncbi:unnamed protein product [Brassica oleracea]
MLISFGFFFILPRFSKIFLTEGIHSVSEASRSINGREFICLYEKVISLYHSHLIFRDLSL